MRNTMKTTVQIYYILFVLLIAIYRSSCQNYYKIGDKDICSNKRTLIGFFTQSINKYEIDFDREHNSVVIERKFNASAVKRMKTECSFKIYTSNFNKHAGIYINIVKLKLRKIAYTGECIDSITVKYNGDIKKRFCGELSPGEIRSIEDTKGKVKITIAVDHRMPFNDPDDFIEFQIVATAFKDCRDEPSQEINCKPIRMSCISKKFANDSIVNCNEPNCSDEHLGCATSMLSSSTVEEEPTTMENLPYLLMTAIISLVLTMLAFGALIWIVYKIRSCCCPAVMSSARITNEHPERRRRHRNRNEEAPHELQEHVPSAPPVDKDDQPPPYDALFPEPHAKPEALNT